MHHEDEACYKATLQVCNDYEDDMLWYSIRDYKRWLQHVGKHQLDPNINTRPYKRRIYMLWLRPLSRVFEEGIPQAFIEDGSTSNRGRYAIMSELFL